jgi:hypothetical protein
MIKLNLLLQPVTNHRTVKLQLVHTQYEIKFCQFQHYGTDRESTVLDPPFQIPHNLSWDHSMSICHLDLHTRGSNHWVRYPSKHGTVKKGVRASKSTRIDKTWLPTKAMRWITLLLWVPVMAFKEMKQSSSLDNVDSSNAVIISSDRKSPPSALGPFADN